MITYDYPILKGDGPSDCVLALGFFDGVHIAHRDLMSRAKKIAKERGLSFGIFTFKSHGNIKISSARLYDDEDKADIFESLGADFAVFADFSAISGCSGADFVKKILCDELCCRVCVAGFNFRFGKGASAGSEELSEFMAECGGEACICEEITTPDGSTLSATLIRNLIIDGKVDEAKAHLGDPYYIKGRVLHGRSDGGKLGFPTANITIPEGRIIPRLGVYRSAVVIDDKIFSAVTNIGRCPTFEGEEIRLEAHIIGFEGDLYGKELKVFLLGFLRDERHFESLDELKMQINIDKNTTINENGDITWQDLGLK